MRKDDRAGDGVAQDFALHMLGIADFPILRIDIPQDALVTPFRVGPSALIGGECAVGRTHDFRRDARRVHDRVVRFLKLLRHAALGHFRELRMRPRMIRNFMPLGDDALHDRGIFRRALADDEERGLDVALLQHIQETRGVGGVRAVVEGHRDVGTIDVALGKRDLLLTGGNGRVRIGGERHVRLGGFFGDDRRNCGRGRGRSGRRGSLSRGKGGVGEQGARGADETEIHGVEWRARKKHEARWRESARSAGGDESGWDFGGAI